MMVTFVSQCEKNALKKTRRVLDAFANRIGDNTWQTLITEDGLLTVKKMLRKTASRSTAVSCHWLRSRSRSQLLWVVGNRSKFNLEGVVPVNYTHADTSDYYDSHYWKTFTEIKHAAAIAGLFHDFGKANVLFQNKLKGKSKLSHEPFRHEWVSLRMFQAFVGEKKDIQWINALVQPNKRDFESFIRDGIDKDKEHSNPLMELSGFARLVGWLILSHHKLPISIKNAPFSETDYWQEKNFSALWNSPKSANDDEQERWQDNWALTEHGSPVNSFHWCSKACFVASAAKAQLNFNQDKNWLNDDAFTTHLARLCLMLADHTYSAKPVDDIRLDWRSENYPVIANTEKNKQGEKVTKQQLDEHLIGVAHYAAKIADGLLKLNSDLPQLEQSNALTSKVDEEYKENFGWQDDARKLAKSLGKETKKHGFFGINMASTGKGKTLANAKIMFAVGQGSGRTRFNVALGLRSLTLQTGKEYRKELELTDEELAILVGGSAVSQLFEMNEKDESKVTIKEQPDLEGKGSESEQDLLDKDLHIDYKYAGQHHSLSRWTKHNDKIEKLLNAPLLVCTIDHLMPACEGIRGGQQIPASLRLLTSDLILDEPDDFGLKDLPALTRLVYWSGMLGSRVLLSTATMPQALANALFRAYKKGWQQFANANIDNFNGEISCAWFDEFKVKSELIADDSNFRQAHSKFVSKRIQLLAKEIQPNRLGYILDVIKQENQDCIYQRYAKTIHQGVLKLHDEHANDYHGISFSIGLVRMANINPQIAVAKALLELTSPSNICIHYCVYHSAYPLAIRSHLELQLDVCLKRNAKDRSWPPKELTDKLKQYPNKHHIFVVLASPVAEVGRDHDYDWAIVEPSSMRSIVQLAGRILRHRSLLPSKPNIFLLSHNIKALKQEKICFEKPGYESEKISLISHDLNSVLSGDQYEKVDATHSISLKTPYKRDRSGKFFNLVELEYAALQYQLFELKDKQDKNQKAASAWWDYSPHWCGEIQKQQRFRQSQKDEAYYLFVDEAGEHRWQWKNEDAYPNEFTPELNAIDIDKIENLTITNGNQFWFDLKPYPIYQQLADYFQIDLEQATKRFAELRVVLYQFNPAKTYQYHYHENLGLHQLPNKKTRDR
ncbi:type I-F CRISPR-associated helicase Cas3f [Pseudoalteromonas sp. MMG005]|uniref:type I-F CRISPR-associated helicase Cas3f n=1 Tax=Pseudoalteromonas sp. MMG005 TaxID=2822682 RepID=UPI001B3A21FE|nr:type I-F CRISPR-associated helicase Cas3f [Pseudoalteromonas sp. MMG005]MBQ4845244.1 type I-F CRISPR-associated helicase Cas3 [Pseudoalteromonas sp. MMG005]